MINIPSGVQAFDFDCGVKALQLVMAYYGIEIREDELISELKSDNDGTSVENMIGVAKKNGFEVIAGRGVSLETVKQYIEKGIPVIVLLQAWAERYMTLEDWKTDYDDGHYAIVIGYQDHIVIFEDPSSFRRTWLTEEEFLARWHDINPRTGEKYDQFAMVLLGKEPVRKAVEHMD
jgi:ABC-type bacteriocin/lantibiotic exporter with double-glycine peptidase domain